MKFGAQLIQTVINYTFLTFIHAETSLDLLKLDLLLIFLLITNVFVDPQIIE